MTETWTCLHGNGCPLHSRLFNNVIHAGNVDVMEWCIQNGCTFDDDSFFNGVMTEKIEVFEWLKLHDCPWGGLSIERVRGTIICLKSIINWLQANGCPELPAN